MKQMTLSCPHCGKDSIKYGSTVCSGCQSEIIYGNTFKSFFMFAIVIPFIGFMGTLMVMETLFTKDWSKTIVSVTTDTGLVLIIIIPWLIISWKVNKKIYKDLIRFIRERK